MSGEWRDNEAELLHNWRGEAERRNEAGGGGRGAGGGQGGAGGSFGVVTR